MKSEQNYEAVEKMQHYITENLHENITLLQLSKIAGYSPYHTERIFKELTGKTPFEYIRRLRLSQSAIKLRDENMKILDVALECLFDSHEGFTRAFSKEFGVSPKRYSNEPTPIKLFMPSNIKDYYLLLNRKDVHSMNENKAVFVQVVERPARKVILIRGKKATEYFEFCEEVGCDVWGILCSVKEALYEPIGMWMPEKLKPNGTSLYTQGVEVPLYYTGEIPERFEIIELPACSMMIFNGEPYEDEKFIDEIGEVMRFIEKFDPRIYGYKYYPEIAPRFQLAPQGYRGYIEGRPVKKI